MQREDKKIETNFSYAKNKRFTIFANSDKIQITTTVIQILLSICWLACHRKACFRKRCFFYICKPNLKQKSENLNYYYVEIQYLHFLKMECVLFIFNKNFTVFFLLFHDDSRIRITKTQQKNYYRTSITRQMVRQWEFTTSCLENTSIIIHGKNGESDENEKKNALLNGKIFDRILHACL